MESLAADPPPPLPAAAPQSPAAPCWTAVLQKKPPPEPQEPISSRVFGCFKSSKGISVAVVDANALIHGDKLASSADKFVSVREVLEEVRDPVSRQRLSFLPLPVETMEPSPEAIKKVVKFARETGDLQTLSDVDLKLIALTYTLEAQIHGTSHLRDSPPPIRVLSVKSLPEAEMPGWGRNVPNLAEWEALEKVGEGGKDHGSRILPLKDLDDNVILVSGSDTKPGEQEGEMQSFGRPRRFTAPKKEIKIDGKKMVADGVDASQGENTDNTDDWQPAVSRSTHRRYLRRKARHEISKASEENGQPSGEASIGYAVTEGEDDLFEGNSDCADPVACKNSHESHCENEHCENDGLVEGNSQECDIANMHKRLDLGATEALKEDKEHDICEDIGSDHQLIEEGSLDDINFAIEGDEIGRCASELDKLEISSQADGSIDTSVVDDGSSEQSWMLRSLSDSTVACVTGDFAMQNVILQIGLRLLAPGGMQIRQLHRWVLKCHACNKVTQEIGRIFCPKCGNGGTLRKVSVTVGENGIALAARRQRIILRGTKFSLPMPQGGRDAITKNPILREDQLPHKLLYPKTKKKPNNQDEFLSADDIFTHAGDKRAPLKPPVRKALAMFSGRRNPNDNHFSRSKH